MDSTDLKLVGAVSKLCKESVRNGGVPKDAVDRIASAVGIDNEDDLHKRTIIALSAKITKLMTDHPDVFNGADPSRVISILAKSAEEAAVSGQPFDITSSLAAISQEVDIPDDVKMIAIAAMA